MYIRRRVCCRIVGDDDGGILFTPEQYEAYKKKIIPQRMENRLFVSWLSPSGIECKMVGPETMCFCRHRLVNQVLQGLIDYQIVGNKEPAEEITLLH